ncbi:hypothetical protein HOD29_01730 [archaeon]|jgi:hypothetical protein|nr:hypothetical protein [archaeon]
MIGGTFLAYYPSLGGGAIGNLLFQWEQAGVFSYVLPFLLIFAMIYGLLNKLNFFGSSSDAANTGNTTSKGINIVIAIAVALMSLQFDLVNIFFAEIFPKVGVGLAIILALLILMGLFWPNNNAFNWVMVFFGLAVAAYVIFSSLGVLGSMFGARLSGWGFYGLPWGTIIGVLVFVGAFIAVVAPGLFRRRNTPAAATGNAVQNAITAAING